MTRAKRRYYEYCTELMKHCDQEWKINCLETAQHILCNCAYFNNQRKDIFNTYNLNIEDIFKDNKGKHLKGQTNRIIDFFEKTKILNRTAKLNKRDLSSGPRLNGGRLYGGGLYGGTLPNYDSTVEFFSKCRLYDGVLVKKHILRLVAPD